MRVALLFICALFATTRLAGQAVDQDKERYAILETVLLADEGTQLHHEPINNLLLDITSSFTEIKLADTTITFDSEKTKSFLAQLQSSAIKNWDAKKVYRFSVIKNDPLAGIGERENELLDSARMKFANKTVKVHHVSLPIFIDDQSVFVLTSFQRVTFMDGRSILNETQTHLYFLKREKRRWKVIETLNLPSH